MKVLLINGPNLNLLGSREPEKYGHATLKQIESEVGDLFQKHHIQLECFQSNAEHELIETIQQSPKQKVDFILFNPAAFTHTSIALRDSLLAVNLPFVEIHLTNPHQREDFRRTSYFSDIAKAVIAGFGKHSYLYAADWVIQQLKH